MAGLSWIYTTNFIIVGDNMNLFLILAFLFFIGSVTGWILELFYRRFFSNANPDRKWINPGACTGPYLPLYGCGLCLLYSIASLEQFSIIKNPIGNKLLLFFFMAVCMTGIEYAAGLISLKIYKVRLWDYTNEWANVQGIICPKFSFYWAVLGALYYFLVHPHIIEALMWLSDNLAFSFVIGLFFGVFIVDVSNSAQLALRLKKLAEEYDVIMRYETLKAKIRQNHEKAKTRYHFFFPFRSNKPLPELISELKESLEKRKH